MEGFGEGQRLEMSDSALWVRYRSWDSVPQDRITMLSFSVFPTVCDAYIQTLVTLLVANLVSFYHETGTQKFDNKSIEPCLNYYERNNRGIVHRCYHDCFRIFSKREDGE